MDERVHVTGSHKYLIMQFYFILMIVMILFLNGYYLPGSILSIMHINI